MLKSYILVPFSFLKRIMGPNFNGYKTRFRADRHAAFLESPQTLKTRPIFTSLHKSGTNLFIRGTQSFVVHGRAQTIRLLPFQIGRQARGYHGLYCRLNPEKRGADDPAPPFQICRQARGYHGLCYRLNLESRAECSRAERFQFRERISATGSLFILTKRPVFPRACCSIYLRSMMTLL